MWGGTANEEEQEILWAKGPCAKKERGTKVEGAYIWFEVYMDERTFTYQRSLSLSLSLAILTNKTNLSLSLSLSQYLQIKQIQRIE